MTNERSRVLDPANVALAIQSTTLERVKDARLFYAAGLFAVLCVSLITSLFFKAPWLWMDEVLSYMLISDPSLAHLNDAVVSGMDANPPLFPNLYWLIAHAVSLDPQFLRSVSVVFFGATIAGFYLYITRLLGRPALNAFLVSAVVGLTYLNFTLSTQIRAYALFLAISAVYFVVLQRLVSDPLRRSWLVANVGVTLLLLFTHNFALFYLAASCAFVGLVFLWSRDRAYLWVIGSYLLALAGWAALWYSRFAIQTEAGKPHSWIPLPTLASFFSVVGDLVPTLSSRLERTPPLTFLPALRFAVVLGLFLVIALPRLRKGFKQIVADPAFVFYLISGFLYFSTIVISVTVSFAHTSVFISRYLWPSHLLLIFQLVYAVHHFAGRVSLPRRGVQLAMPVFMAGLAAFIFMQNRKIVVFPSAILNYLPALEKGRPVFVETADYFLPIWFHHKEVPIHYVLDWESAARPGNLLSTTVEHKILKSVGEKYQVPTIVPVRDFSASAFSRFYVVDEDVIYGMERFFESGQVRIVRELPMAIPGHRLLECVYENPRALAAAGTGLP